MAISGHPVGLKINGNTVTTAYYNGELVFAPSTVDEETTFHFSSTGPFTISMTKNWNGTIEFSTNGKTWTEWSGSEITAVQNTSDKFYKIYFRGVGNTYLNSGSYKGFQYTGDETVDIIGDLMTLLDFQKVANGELPPIREYAFSYVFSAMTKLRSCKSALPHTTVPQYGYRYMFYGCSSLEEGPTLISAQVVNERGMECMFSGCSKLATVQDSFDFTEMGDYACNCTFSSCAITKVPTFKNTLKVGLYAMYGMFSNCKSMTNSSCFDISLKNTANSCCSMMFNACESLKYAANITCSDTTERFAFQMMFNNCPALIDPGSIVLGGLTCGQYAFYRMFSYCTSLQVLPKFSGYQVSDIGVMGEMFSNCNALNQIWTFTTLGSGINYIPSGAMSNMFNCPQIEFSTYAQTGYLAYKLTSATVVNASSNKVDIKAGTALVPTDTYYVKIGSIVTLNG